MSDAIAALIEAERLPDDYRAIVDEYWRPLAEEIARRTQATRPLLVGINGAQGSGKTTLCHFVEVLLAERGLKAVTLSLDDLYLSRAERAEAAADHHPLFATRGVPGTHDVERGMAILDRLLAGKSADLPIFDKATDEPANAMRHVEGPVDIVLFEGWCVGASPQSAAELREAVNALERGEDPEGTWRREVNRRLATDYAELFARIDLLVMLKVPDFATVRDHRRLQESKLGANNPAGPAVMDDAALDRFLAHYQRLTEHMLAEMPARADILVELGRDQRPVRRSALVELQWTVCGVGGEA
jgi:D-glycerate 3-kinase